MTLSPSVNPWRTSASKPLMLFQYTQHLTVHWHRDLGMDGLTTELGKFCPDAGNACTVDITQVVRVALLGFPDGKRRLGGFALSINRPQGIHLHFAHAVDFCDPTYLKDRFWEPLLHPTIAIRGLARVSWY